MKFRYISRFILLVLLLAACAPARAKSIGGSTPDRLAVTPMATATIEPTAPSITPTPSPICDLIELSDGLHIASSCSYTMTENEAAGPMVCHIQRDTCAYGRLIVDRDPLIVFSRHKPDPYADEDAMMHPAMLVPLTKLKELVDQEWGQDVRLMVTAAYDSSLLDHDVTQSDLSRKYSLHFEGRSIDLVTYPLDRSKLPRLCALALYAGFDWVHDEGDHCHASLKAESVCGCQ
jgi:hypothetical protein